MAQNSGIGWTHHTANLWWGCVEISELCDNCYAREWAARFDRAKWGALEPRLAIKSVWSDLAKFQRLAAAAGEVHRVFVGSMMDIAEKAMPVVDGKGAALGITTADLRRRLCEDVVPASPNLLFLFLTKRPQNLPKSVPGAWLETPPENVMYGTSVGTQGTFDQAVPALLEMPGYHFLSMEPLLGSVNVRTDGLCVTCGQCESRHQARSGFFHSTCRAFAGATQHVLPEVDWGIVGIESLGARVGRFGDGYEAAARSIIQNFQAAGVPIFHKQFPVEGRVSHDMNEWPEDLRVQEFPETGVRAKPRLENAMT